MPAAHGYIGSTVSFSHYNRHLGDSGLAVSVQYLRSMPDDTGMFLIRSRKISGGIHQCQQRNIEAITESDEPCRFVRSIHIKNTGQDSGLISDNPDRLTSEPCKTYHHVSGIMLLYFKEIRCVHNATDDIFHAVGLSAVIGNYIVTKGLIRGNRFSGRRVLIRISREEGEQFLECVECLGFTFRIEMGISGDGGMGHCAPQFLLGYIFSQNRLNDLRPCNEHV